jgi:hypothetical protein
MDNSWESWDQLTAQERAQSLREADFWQQLSEPQRESFLSLASWDELRKIPDARMAKLASLQTLEETCERLTISSADIYWLISTRKLMGAYLVDGTWKFDRPWVDRWVEQMGGLEAVKAELEERS